MQDTFPTEKRTGGVLRLFMVGVLTIATTLGVNLVIRTVAYAIFPLSPIFLPLPIGSMYPSLGSCRSRWLVPSSAGLAYLLQPTLAPVTP